MTSTNETGHKCQHRTQQQSRQTPVRCGDKTCSVCPSNPKASLLKLPYRFGWKDPRHLVETPKELAVQPTSLPIPTSQKGLFAATHLKRGTCLGSYAGEVSRTPSGDSEYEFEIYGKNSCSIHLLIRLFKLGWIQMEMWIPLLFWFCREFGGLTPFHICP